MWVHSMHVCVPERSFLCSCVWCQCVYIHMCMCGPAWPAQPVSPTLHVCGEQHWMCVRACSQNIMQNSLPLQLETKKKSQPGGHFEIPGAHLANPGNWGVYISATERGKRPDAPLEQLSSSVHRGITHLTVGDRPLRVCVSHGRRKGIERAMCKVIKHHMTTCSRET